MQNLHALGGPLGSLENILATPGPSTQSVEELQRRTRLERAAKENAAVNGDQLRHPSLVPAFSRSYSVNAGTAMHGATSINAMAASGRPEFARGAYARPNFAAQPLYSRRRPVATGKNAPHSTPGDAENSHHVDDTHSRSIAAAYEAKLTELLRATDACKHEPPNLSEPGDAEAYLAQLRTPEMQPYIREIRKGAYGPLFDVAASTVAAKTLENGVSHAQYLRIDANFKKLAAVLNAAVGAVQTRKANEFIAELHSLPQPARVAILHDFAERLTRVEKNNRLTVFRAILHDAEDLPREAQAAIKNRLAEHVGFLPERHRLSAYRAACASADRMANGTDGGSALRLIDGKSDGPGYFAREGIYRELHRWFSGLQAEDRAPALHTMLASAVSLPADRELPQIGSALENVAALPQKTEQHDALVQLKHRLDVHRVAAKQERLPTMAAAKSEWGCRVVRLPDIGTNAEVLKAAWDAKREAFGV